MSNFLDLPNQVGGGSGNLTQEYARYQVLYNDPDRTTTGQVSESFTLSGQNYNTIDYPSDPDVFNKGEDGFLNLLERYVLVNSLVSSDTLNNAVSAYNAIQNTLNSDLAKWYGNTKLADDGQDISDYGPVSGGGTLTLDTTNVRIGSYSKRLTNTTISGAGSVFVENDNDNLDLDKFNDGTDITQNDFVQVVLYVSDVSALSVSSDAVRIRYSNSTPYSGADSAGIEIANTDLVSGWNYIDVDVSDLVINGSGSLVGIQSSQLLVKFADGSQNEYVSFQLIQLVKKSPYGVYPSPFGEDFMINSGKWFVGYEYGTLVWKLFKGGTDISALETTVSVEDFNATLMLSANPSDDAGYISWIQDSNNQFWTNILNDNLSLSVEEDGITTTITTPMAVADGDVVVIMLEKDGTNLRVTAYLNGEYNNPFLLSYETTISGYGIYHTGTRNTLDTYNMYYYSTSVSSIGHVHSADIAEVAKSTPQGDTYEDATVDGTTITANKVFNGKRAFITMPSEVSGATITLVLDGNSETLKQYNSSTGAVENCEYVPAGLVEVYDDGVNFIYAPKGAGGASVQRGTLTMTSTPTDVSISEVDLTKSVVKIYQNGATGLEDWVSVRFEDSTTLRFIYETGNTNSVDITWEVIEFKGIRSLQSGEFDQNINTGYNLTISEVDLDKSIVLFSFNTQSTGTRYIGETTSNITTSTNVYFENNANITTTVSWFVVEFN